MNAKTGKIARLNDEARCCARVITEDLRFAGGDTVVVVTPGFMSLHLHDQKKVFDLVRNFETFNEDNDPYGEHDFGSVEHNNVKYFWKFDFFEKGSNFQYGSVDASNPSVTTRVLTVMQADEY